MAAQRKPAAEKAVIRHVSWRPWVDEFLSTMQPGSRSPWLNGLVESSSEFRAWWAATVGEKSPE
jgi:hypothetical protein